MSKSSAVKQVFIDKFLFVMVLFQVPFESLNGTRERDELTKVTGRGVASVKGVVKERMHVCVIDEIIEFVKRWDSGKRIRVVARCVGRR